MDARRGSYAVSLRYIPADLGYNNSMEYHLDKNPVIAASEINNFVYCPMAFFLKRAGMDVEHYEPDTLEEKEKVKRQIDLISAGRVFHEDIAMRVERVLQQEKRAKNNTFYGMALLALGIFLAILFYFNGW